MVADCGSLVLDSGSLDIMKKNILVLYGGVSTEHEVSIVSALQVMHALKEAGNKVMPGYISKKGNWYLGNDRFFEPGFYRNLKQVERAGKKMILPASAEVGMLTRNWLGFGGSMDQPEVIFPVFHGRNGEDGSVQGLLEMVDLPYVGCNVGASGVGMDKFVSKRIAQTVGLTVAKDVLIAKCEWTAKTKGARERLSKLKLPVFVKPATLGSSIGIVKVDKKEDLENALEVAFCYDQRVLVEEMVDSPTEVNISILGNGPYELSVTEQPVSNGEILSFEDKYLGDSGKSKSKGMASLSRIMPARVDKILIGEIEEGARRFFGAIGGKGIARIDFMVDGKGKLYFNEINTMPGSLAFYLWEKSGLSFHKLVTKLVDLAVDDWREKKKLITTFESNILSGFARNSLKG